MIRTGRILLVEPEEALRSALYRQLAEAGHDVAAVPDEAGAAVLLEEGLDPDVILAGSDRHDEPGSLQELAPRAVQLWIDRRASGIHERLPTRRGDDSGPGSSWDVLRQVEEALLDHSLLGDTADDAWRSIDLARRLANALPRTPTPEGRIDLLTETFHAYFGVHGTLVIRRSPIPDEWIEVSQGLDDEVAQRISSEIAGRARYRDIRPFLARLNVGGRDHDVACLAVHRGDGGTDLALDLERAPVRPDLREALMNLVGSALRAATCSERLARTQAFMQSDAPTFETLLETAHEFGGIESRETLCDRILSAVRRDLGMARSALFLWRKGGEGLLSLAAVSGFSNVMLDRIGLSGFHGIGQQVLAQDGAVRLAELRHEGVAERESRMLSEAGLQWGAKVAIGECALGLLLFGVKEGEPRLEEGEHRTLRALLGSAAIALRHLGEVEELQGLLTGGLRGLAAAAELQRPQDRGHGERVARLARRLGRAAGLDSRELRNLSYCALVHDVGKVGVPPEADAGVPDRTHPVLAARILSAAEPPADVVQGVEQHHERWDGQGFPYGLKGTSIHLFGRIVSIANAFDRLTHGPEETLSTEDALRRLELAAGILHDPGLVATLVGELDGRAGRPRADSGEFPVEEIVRV